MDNRDKHGFEELRNWHASFNALEEFWSDGAKLVDVVQQTIAAARALEDLQLSFEWGWDAPRYRDNEYTPRVSLDLFTFTRRSQEGSFPLVQVGIQICLCGADPLIPSPPCIATIVRRVNKSSEFPAWQHDPQIVPMDVLMRIQHLPSNGIFAKQIVKSDDVESTQTTFVTQATFITPKAALSDPNGLIVEPLLDALRLIFSHNSTVRSPKLHRS